MKKHAVITAPFLYLFLHTSKFIQAHQCDVSVKDRLAWGSQAVENLSKQGFTSSTGSLKFAPFGSISNPNGTYGSLLFQNYSSVFPEPSNEFCQCLTGNETVSSVCNLLESPLASSSTESVCKQNFVLGKNDAIIVIACTPPNSQYFSLQTNIFSKWSNDTTPGIFFPEISPYNALNNMLLNTTSRNPDSSRDSSTSTISPYNSAFVTISTPSTNTAMIAKEALINAGVPEWAINIDALGSSDVKFWDGISDWKEQLPDTLEMVYRINGAIDQQGADVYVLESEFFPLHHAYLIRAPTSIYNDDNDDSLSVPWQPRIVSSEETNYSNEYGKALDQFAIDINNTAKEQGYALSYYGDVLTAMDYGYYQPSSTSTSTQEKEKRNHMKKTMNKDKKESIFSKIKTLQQRHSDVNVNVDVNVDVTDGDVDDVQQCCLSYPHNSEFWSSTIHFSTKDCLYEIYGWKADVLGGWNDYEPTLLSTTRYLSTETSGPPPTNLSNYYSFSCTGGENASGYDALQVNYECFDNQCNQCSWNGDAAVAGIPQGCISNNYYNDDDDDDDDDDNGYEMYTCIDGIPYAVQYLDDQCTHAVYNYDLSSCVIAETDHPTEEMWTGGVFRDNSIIVMIGAMSNELNSSVFHDVYLPIPGTYNTPDLQLDFTESQLNGSGLTFMPKGGDEDVYSKLFIGQWGRACLESNNENNENDNIPCYEIPPELMYPNATFYMLIRHYLDPNTGTGPHKDALPRHRVMVFDKT